MSKKKQYLMSLALFLLAISLILGGIVHRHRQLYSMDRPRKVLVRDLNQEDTPLVHLPPEKLGTSSREMNWHLAELMRDYDPEREDAVEKHLEVSIECMERLNLLFTALELGYVPVSIEDAADTRPSFALIIVGILSLIVAMLLFFRARMKASASVSINRRKKEKNEILAVFLLVSLLLTGCRKGSGWERHYERGNGYYDRGEYAQAQMCFLRALKKVEKFGQEDRRVGLVLNNLAMTYKEQRMYDDAEPLYRRSLAISERIYGPNDPKVEKYLNNLASVCSRLDKFAEAEALYRRCLTIDKKYLGQNNPVVAIVLNNLAMACRAQRKYAKAESFLEEALSTWKAVYGPNHPSVALGLCNLADIHQLQQKYGDAEPLYLEAILIIEKAQGRDHPNLVRLLGNYAELLRKTGRESKAAILKTRANSIEEAK
jgi:tetratricopeptide (TPR) repeat protein